MISIPWTSPNVLLSCLVSLICLAGPSGCTSKPSTTGARFVVATTNEAVRDDGDALAILAGWDVRLAGQPFEAHDLPTRAGLLSYGRLRFHCV